jgi:soluble lytic murein transglycosylase-like protein
MNPLYVLGAAGLVALIVTPQGQRAASAGVGVVKQATAKRNPKNALPAGLERYRRMIEKSCAANRLRVSLLGALIERENARFDPRAVRPEPGLLGREWAVNAIVAHMGDTWQPLEMATSYGLTQILALVAVAELGWKGTKAKILEPDVNIELGARYLRRMLSKYKSESEALAAYNGGGAAVAAMRAGRAHTSSDYARDVMAREARIQRGAV